MAGALSRNYKALSPPERLVLTVEAMARGDEDEADRLDDSCPRRTHVQGDAEFTERLRRS